MLKSTDTWTTIRTKRAVRDYDSRPVPEEIVHRVLQAGRLTGSARNIQPWRFILVREETSKKDLSKCGRFSAHLAGAAFVVVICTEANQSRWATFDAGRTAQNMMLTAWDQRVGSCVVALHDELCAQQLLEIPEEYDIAA